MNCKNFEAVISDLAREQMLEAHTREDALTHVEECEECAARLEDERALTRGLRGLAASMANVEAPASLEANLLERFRASQAQPETSPVVVEMPQRVARWQKWYPHAVAAAVVLMFAVGGASMLRLRQQGPETSQPKAVAGNESRGVKQATPASTAAPSETPAEAGPDTIAAVDNTGTEGRGQKLSKSEVDAIMGNSAAQRRPTNVPKSKVNKSGMTGSGEIATDFMPVSYGDNLNEIDNGRIVRVEMPRSALAQFGIPVSPERSGERIKADVLIGDDGMARAIRFVR
ncbi:MAG TPA: hypothetical protein VJS44_22630 [Pyrinomonadaceae bacterium]|nr:hypothetical protein [Pyrinomonadaceae bacterium]